jgi:hypothetical protein
MAQGVIDTRAIEILDNIGNRVNEHDCIWHIPTGHDYVQVMMVPWTFRIYGESRDFDGFEVFEKLASISPVIARMLAKPIRRQNA